MNTRTYSGPVVDAHTHFDAQARPLLTRLLSQGLVSAVLNFWDLTWPPSTYEAWRRTWGDGAHPQIQLLHTPDLSRVVDADFDEFIRSDVRRASDLGARGIKVWKNLGLMLRDTRSDLVPVDHPSFEPLWATASEVGLPVAIHVGDPPTFFAALTPENESYEALREFPEYWFGDRSRFPPLEQIHDQLERVVAANPQTAFVGLHFGCYMPLRRVQRMLSTYPNYSIDTATRTFDIARDELREDALAIFREFPDRIVFGTDLIRTAAYDLPDLGRQRRDAVEDFYEHHWRIFETEDSGIEVPFAFLKPRPLRGLGLSDDQLSQLYHENAARVYGLSIPSTDLDSEKELDLH